MTDEYPDTQSRGWNHITNAVRPPKDGSEFIYIDDIGNRSIGYWGKATKRYHDMRGERIDIVDDIVWWKPLGDLPVGVK